MSLGQCNTLFRLQYFRNTLSYSGGKNPVLPVLLELLGFDNTQSMRRTQWQFDAIAARVVHDLSIKRNAEDYLKHMKPIAIAQDKV